MTTPAEMLREFERKPFSLWDLRGKEFTVLEDLPINKPMRETNEMNKWNKPQDYFFIKVEQSLYQKDLKMTENEMLALFLSMPKGVSNYQGSILNVDSANKMNIKYVGSTNQDLNGNRIGNSQNIPQQAQPEIQIKQLVDKMLKAKEFAIVVNEAKIKEWAKAISNGKEDELVKAAKDAGVLVESQGIFQVI